MALTQARDRLLREAYFQVCVGSRPQKCYPRQPVLAIDRLPRMPMFLRRQNPRHRIELRPCDDSSNRAWSNPHLRIVPDALVFPHHRARHHEKLTVLLATPHRRTNPDAALAKRSQANVFLTLNGLRNLARHEAIVKQQATGETDRLRNKAVCLDSVEAHFGCRLWFPAARAIAPTSASVLQA